MKKMTFRQKTRVMDSVIVDRVMEGFIWKKHDLIEHLFPDATEQYKDKWRERPVAEFWAFLDLDNKIKTIDFFEV